jgi:serine/threonine-protein kinase
MDGDHGDDHDTELDRPASSDDVSTRAGTLQRRLQKAQTLPSSSIDRYQLLRLLGTGGMGEVYAARDETLGREVAIKRVRGEASSVLIGRFLREARIQGCLDHPAIPPVHELGRGDDGRPFIVMKRLTGTTLATILSQEALVDPEYSRVRLLRAFADVCIAVEFAHAHGVIHRDLKPSNIMLGEFGEVYVLDWGIAKVVGDTDPAIADVQRASTERGDETVAGAVVGTPGYMAPEQLAAREIDGRADVYSLGCVLFEILTNVPLAVGGDRGSGDAHPARSAPDRDIPPELDELCAAACAIDVDRRLRTARELGARVQHYLDGDRDLALRRRLAREHLSRAQATTADEEATAMREAGRALALDPELAGATELVSRLMLEPPKTMPPEVETMLAASDADAARRHARLAALAALGYLLFVPALAWIGMTRWTPLIVLVGLVAALGGIGWQATRSGPTPAHYAIVAIGCAAIIAWFSWGLTPVLVAPGLACVTVMVLVAGAGFQRRRYLIPTVAALVVGIVAPWIAEIVGWSSQTIAFDGDTVVLRPPLFVGGSEFQWRAALGLMIWSVMIVVVGAIHARTLSRAERDAKQRLQLQAWRLRQLSSSPAILPITS